MTINPEIKTCFPETINRVLTPPDKREPLVIDLFAGCGGLALGFEAQGFETLGYEMIDVYCSTYKNNLKGMCINAVLTPGTEYPNSRVIIGGPPCQPFSVIGKQQGLKDSRDGFPAFIAAVSKIKPDIWLFENVRGLYYRSKWYLDLIIGALRSLGYMVDVHLINARNYGVPQNRERVIVVGHKGKFNFPRPLPFNVTSGEALRDLLQTLPPDSKFLTPEMDAYIHKYEVASKCINPRDLHLDSPSRTLTCRNLAAPTGDMMRVRLPDGRRRRLTVRESARLQSFPDWFVFDGDEESQYYQIGNAVPPLLSYHLAGAVREYLVSDFRLSEGEIDVYNKKFAPEGEISDFSSRSSGEPINKQLEFSLLLSDNLAYSIEKDTSKSRAYQHKYYVTTRQTGSDEISMERENNSFIDLIDGSASFKKKPPELQQLINQTLYILYRFGIPFTGLTPRRLERMALAFLAVSHVTKSTEWAVAKDLNDSVSMTTRDIIGYINKYFGEKIADSSYDDIRRQDLSLCVLAGIILSTKPGSKTNSPTRGYALNPAYGDLVRTFGSSLWEREVSKALIGKGLLREKFSDKRELNRVPVKLPSGVILSFSPGEHNELQKAIIEEFLELYGFGAEVLYVGDTEKKMLLYDEEKLAKLNFPKLAHEELPDVIAFSQEKNWLYLIEAVHSSGPIDNVRRLRLREMTANTRCGVIYITAFLTRKIFRQWVETIAWETEVWIAESPDHIIHFDGEKFLGPHSRLAKYD